MSSVSLADVVLAARVLARCSPQERDRQCDILLDRAEQAACFVDVAGRAHPYGGDGSLSAVALRKSKTSMPALLTPDFRACLSMVLTKLANREKNAEIQSTCLSH